MWRAWMCGRTRARAASATAQGARQSLAETGGQGISRARGAAHEGERYGELDLVYDEGVERAPFGGKEQAEASFEGGFHGSEAVLTPCELEHVIAGDAGLVDHGSAQDALERGGEAAEGDVFGAHVVVAEPSVGFAAAAYPLRLGALARVQHQDVERPGLDVHLEVEAGTQLLLEKRLEGLAGIGADDRGDGVGRFAEPIGADDANRRHVIRDRDQAAERKCLAHEAVGVDGGAAAGGGADGELLPGGGGRGLPANRESYSQGEEDEGRAQNDENAAEHKGVWRARVSPNRRGAAEGVAALGLSIFGMKCARAGQDANSPIRTGRASAAFAAVAPAPDRGGEDEKEAAIDEHLSPLSATRFTGRDFLLASFPR